MGCRGSVGGISRFVGRVYDENNGFRGQSGENADSRGCPSSAGQAAPHGPNATIAATPPTGRNGVTESTPISGACIKMIHLLSLLDSENCRGFAYHRR